MNPLIDTHGRRIRYLRISITDRCNLRCRYCMPATGVEWIPHERVMKYEEYLRVINICLARGVEKVRITGGEPLVRRGIIDFIRDMGQIDGLRDLSLTTNGMLLSAMAGNLRKAGLQRLNISLDTLKRDKFAHITRVDGFDKVIDGIRRAAEEGFSPIKINVVAMRGFNDIEIPDFAALTLRYDADIRFIELMPMGCANRFGEHELINATEIRGIIEESFGPLEDVEYSHGPATVAKIRGAIGRLGFIGALSEHNFCSRCNRIRITASGHLRPCLFSGDEIDLLTPIRQGISDGELEALIEEGVRMKNLNHMLCAGSAPAAHQGCKSMMYTLGG